MPRVGNHKNRNLGLLFLVLFILDLIIPDPIPIIDEILLGILAFWFNSK